MTSEHIVIVEDDERISRQITRYLETEGFSVASCVEGRMLYDEIEKQIPDCVLLDLKLPDIHGLDLAKTLRASHPNIGIIIVTGAVDAVDRIVGLEVGADDYIVKPFVEREVLARIRSVLRRISATTGSRHEKSHKNSVISFEDFVADTSAFTLTRSGVPVELTSHEFMMLLVLIDSENQILSRDTILDRLSGRDWYPTDRSVDVLIGKLRGKLGESGTKLIKTIRGVGYVFTAQLTRLDR